MCFSLSLFPLFQAQGRLIPEAYLLDAKGE
jgi:hypothetical protein